MTAFYVGYQPHVIKGFIQKCFRIIDFFGNIYVRLRQQGRDQATI